mmetsp:Transcript_97473/g.168089  ORF Transcript_97473/g.168089 Transcript_97473/m.168089 type:complete len:254 (-) Transcript_97473:513-1274(-)
MDVVNPVQPALDANAHNVAEDDADGVGQAGGGEGELPVLLWHLDGNEAQSPHVDRPTQQPDDEAGRQEGPIIPQLVPGGQAEEDQEAGLQRGHHPQAQPRGLDQHAGGAGHEDPPLVHPVGQRVEELAGLGIRHRESDGCPRACLHGILCKIDHREGDHVRPEGSGDGDALLDCHAGCDLGHLLRPTQRSRTAGGVPRAVPRRATIRGMVIIGVSHGGLKAQGLLRGGDSALPLDLWLGEHEDVHRNKPRGQR